MIVLKFNAELVFRQNISKLRFPGADILRGITSVKIFGKRLFGTFFTYVNLRIQSIFFSLKDVTASSKYNKKS